MAFECRLRRPRHPGPIRPRAIEREILTTLYDVLAPGNHGWPHCFEPGLREMMVCANTLDDATGQPLFDRLRVVDVHGRRVAITAVIDVSAFHTVPADQRAGHCVIDPVTALRELMLEHHHHVDSWPAGRLSSETPYSEYTNTCVRGLRF